MVTRLDAGIHIPQEAYRDIVAHVLENRSHREDRLVERAPIHIVEGSPGSGKTTAIVRAQVEADAGYRSQLAHQQFQLWIKVPGLKANAPSLNLDFGDCLQAHRKTDTVFFILTAGG